MMKVVTTKREAWAEADRIFPTDYEQDMSSTRRAGYPVYRSTAEGNDSWISDLGNRLELNIWNDGSLDSTNIWIEDKPKIIETASWSYESVRTCCIKNNLYTCGTVRQYDEMFQMVMATENPELIDIYNVAKNIADHSEEDITVTYVMFLLNKDAIIRTYEVM